jgi:subtilase family serine protease
MHASAPEEFLSMKMSFFHSFSSFLQIVARGITLVAASGDQGAPGDNFPR